MYSAYLLHAQRWHPLRIEGTGDEARRRLLAGGHQGCSRPDLPSLLLFALGHALGVGRQQHVAVDGGAERAYQASGAGFEGQVLEQASSQQRLRESAECFRAVKGTRRYTLTNCGNMCGRDYY